MRVPSYRKHKSGQARVTLRGKDYLLGPYGSEESKRAYAKLIAEFTSKNRSSAFGKSLDALRIEDVLLAYIKHARSYYAQSTEFKNMQTVVRVLMDLYGDSSVVDFGAAEFKAVRQHWLSDPKRSRQYVNKCMKRTLRIIKWAVGEGMMKPDAHYSCKCVEPLKKGRCGPLREAKRITCVDVKLVEATLPLLTRVQADMVRFQMLTGCRPGEVCAITPSLVRRSGAVWEIDLVDHKTSYRGKSRTIFVGPKAQAVLAPYLLRASETYCFSPIESERLRRERMHATRVTPLQQGNSPGTNVARKPRKKPGDRYTTDTYGNFIKYACVRGQLTHWSPNQLRHNAATEIRRQFGIEAAQVILGHSSADVTQVYAEADREQAKSIAARIG
ncbi:MAG: site-specific integrase [Pirellulales bacterium]